jgi:phage tail-like protein
MAFSVTNFKSDALQGGGYRPTLFEVQLTYGGTNFRYLCQSTSVPAMTMGVIEVPYFGRKIKMAGDRTYAEWTTTVMVEEGFGARDWLEQWSMDINQGDTNVRNIVGEDYKQDIQILLYNKQGGVIREYDLIGCWPSDVGTIELDWNNTDQMATYQVTWAFDYMNKP